MNHQDSKDGKTLTLLIWKNVAEHRKSEIYAYICVHIIRKSGWQPYYLWIPPMFRCRNKAYNNFKPNI